ncbi:MAG: RsmB/NOP family class I SAM-dependent RNA methyltransferase [Burkholderiaceae bacterium]
MARARTERRAAAPSGKRAAAPTGKRAIAGDRAAGGRRRSSSTPAALGPEQALVELLRVLLRFDQPADRTMQGFFRAHPAIGRRDRQRLADHAYAVLRHRRLYAHLADSGPGPLERRLALLAQADGTVGGWLSPSVPEQQWLARVAQIDREALPWAVRVSLPDWLAGRLREQWLDEASREALGAAMLEPAGLDLRVNPLRAQPSQVREALNSAGIAAVDDLPAELTGLESLIRVRGRPNLAALPAFEQGWFEVQDAGSQWVVRACAARRGQTVVDLCAGAGGKTLALAAQMRSSGQIYACDISARRLQALRPRLARSGATNVQPMRIESEHDGRLGRLRGRADVVLVDAPCSGTGTLRRNPDLKWRYGEDDLKRLAGQQRAILLAAAELVAPGGRLVYATCSLLRDENEAVALDAERSWREAGIGFVRQDIGLARRSQAAAEPCDAACAGMIGERPEGESGSVSGGTVSVSSGAAADALSSQPRVHDGGDEAFFLRLWPHLQDCDGFFAAAWRREDGGR